MRKLIDFIRSIYVGLLFVVLELIAFNYYARSTHYTQARLLARSNQLVGGVHTTFAGIRHYFLLGGENRALLTRVAALEERLARYDEAAVSVRLDSIAAGIGESKYRVTSAAVVSNSVNRAENLIVLNRGRRDGIVPDMAVLAPDGSMAGYIVDCTDRYSVALSVLNTSFRASGRLVGSDYYGSVSWDGTDQNIVTLAEVSKYADLQPGQKVVSTGFSQYFPADVPIGEVVSAELNETRTAFTVRVKLAAEMSRLHNVLLIENRDLNEIRDLESSDAVQQHIRQN